MKKDPYKDIIARRHPEYESMLPHWKFLMDTYVGGTVWFRNNIFPYYKEGDEEFNKRVSRSYRFNHTREIVDLVSKYIFRAKVSRNSENASEAVNDFWKQPTLGNLTIEQYARQMSDKASIYGRIWIVVDNTVDDGAISQADLKRQSGRIYSYTVSPENALDMAFDREGELIWILFHEQVRDDLDPFDSTGAVKSMFRLWTRNEWFLFSPDEKNKTKVNVESGVHNLGRVPVICLDHITNDESKYSSPALINDIAYLDRAVANYLSNLDAIIQDQTFSQLAIPVQGLLPGSDAHKQVLEMGTKRLFTYDGDGGAAPFFLAPDPKQAQLIITAIRQIINEIYHSVGVAGERTKQDNAQGIDNSSGVAKAYDFERVNALLTSKAAMLMRAENEIVELVNLWAGQENKVESNLVQYPETFDVRGLYDEFEIASQLMLVDAPHEVRRAQMEQLIHKLFPQASKATVSKMIAELKDWPFEIPTSELSLSTNSVSRDANTGGSSGSNGGNA